MARVFLTLLCSIFVALGALQLNSLAQDQRDREFTPDDNDRQRVESRKESYAKELGEQLEVAFAQLGNSMELTDDQKLAIKKALRSDVDKIAEKRDKASRTFVDYEVPLELQTRLLEELKVQGCDPQKLAAYRQSVEAKHEFVERVAKESFVRILDEYFILSGEQVQLLKDTQGKHWSPRLTNRSLEAAAYSWHNPAELYRDLADHLPKDFFAATQNELLKSYEEYSVVALRSMAASIRKGLAIENDEAEDVHDKTYREWLSHSFAMKLAEIEDICQTNESQQKKLAVIEKGVVGQIIERRDELMNTVVENMKNRGGARRGSSMDAAVEFARSPNQAIDKNSRWMATVPKTLDEDQLSKIEQYWQERSHRSYRSKIGCGVLSLTKLMPDLQFDQQRELAEQLLERAIATESIPLNRSNRSYYSNNELFVLLSDEDYQEVLSDSQWAKWMPVISRTRKKQEEMQANSE